MTSTPATQLPGPSGTRFADVEWFTTIDSTNQYLLEQARGGRRAPLVAVADAQTAGRGRLDRTWLAPAGASLLVSVVVQPKMAVEQWPRLLGAAGLSAVEVVTRLCDVPAQLKWPNDVVVGDRKLAGLLAEVAGDSVVLGMGLNLEWSSFPSAIADTATAISLLGGRVPSRRVLLHAWLERLDYWLGLLERDALGAKVLLRHQRSRSATLGRHVRVELPKRVIEGRATDLTSTGELVVVDGIGTEHRVGVGDVVHLRLSD